MIKLPFNVTKASAELVVRLMVQGILTVGENGLTTAEPGIYAIKENIPADR